MRKFLALSLALLLGACVGPGGTTAAGMKDREVPTALFVFFEENSAEPTEGSAKVLREVVALLSNYDTLSARVVGHNGASETSGRPEFPLDMQRSTYVIGQLVGKGVSASRLGVSNMGSKEAMAASVGGDESVDRRVEIIMINRTSAEQ
jgi:outer membrane protein OmpA-like peptidoglycan-associated protein